MGCNCGLKTTVNRLLSRDMKPKKLDSAPKYGLLDAATDLITKGQEAMVSDSIKEKRLSVCKRCSYLVKLPLGMNGTGNCSKCGCFVDAKTSFVKSQCPQSKW